MKEAGAEEYNNAKNVGDFDSDGIPFITVYVDGVWSKRSYGHNYNAASGVASEINTAVFVPGLKTTIFRQMNTCILETGLAPLQQWSKILLLRVSIAVLQCMESVIKILLRTEIHLSLQRS